jgi:hypothetical protein
MSPTSYQTAPPRILMIATGRGIVKLRRGGKLLCHLASALACINLASSLGCSRLSSR